MQTDFCDNAQTMYPERQSGFPVMILRHSCRGNDLAISQYLQLLDAFALVKLKGNINITCTSEHKGHY